MSTLLSAIEFIKIDPPSEEGRDSEWLDKQVILAQGSSVKISAQVNLVLAAKLLVALDNVCERLVYEIDNKNSVLIFDHSPEEAIWPEGITLPPEILFGKSKKQIPQLEINLTKIWKNTKGEFFKRLQKAVSYVEPELKPAFMVNLIGGEEEKLFALLVAHAFLHKAKALRLIFRGENFKIW